MSRPPTHPSCSLLGRRCPGTHAFGNSNQGGARAPGTPSIDHFPATASADAKRHWPALLTLRTPDGTAFRRVRQRAEQGKRIPATETDVHARPGRDLTRSRGAGLTPSREARQELL